MSGSNPGLAYGQVPTPLQWNSYFAGKQDYSSVLAGVITQGGAAAPGSVVPITGGVTMTGAINIVAGAAGSQQPAQMAQIISNAGGTLTGPLILEAGGTLSAALNYVYNYPSVPTTGYGKASNRWVIDQSMGGTITGINSLDSTQLYVDGTDGNSWWVNWINYFSASAQDANGQRSDVVQYIAGSRQVSPAGLAVGRTPVPSALTTVAATLATPGTAVAVANLAYLEWTYPANQGAVQVSPSNLGTVVIGSGTYTYNGISNGTTTDVVMGQVGPGTIYTTTNVSTSDATLGHQVIQCVAGEPFELQNITFTDFSGYDSNRAGGINNIEYAMNVAGPDSAGQTSALPGVPVATYGLLNGSAGSRYFLAFYPRFTQGNLGSGCPYTQAEIHSYFQFNLPNNMFVKQALLFYGNGTFSSSIIDTRSLTKGAGAYTLRVGNGDGVAWGGSQVGSGGLYGNGNESVIINNGSSGVAENYLEITYNGGQTGYLTPGMKLRGNFSITSSATLTSVEAGYMIFVSNGPTIALPQINTMIPGECLVFNNTSGSQCATLQTQAGGNYIQSPGTLVTSLALLPYETAMLMSDGTETYSFAFRSSSSGSGGPSMTVANLGSIASQMQSFDAGKKAWASNGRANSSQGANSGTGCTVSWNGSAWIADWSGVAVAS